MLNNIKHIESAVKLKLVNIRFYDYDLKRFKRHKKEFDHVAFHKAYGRYFKPTNLFSVTDDEFFHACKAIDSWVEERYKGSDVLVEYKLKDRVPVDLYERGNLPAMIQVYWDILFKVNQMKWCNYQILKKSIPEFEDLRITLFAGYRAQSPFNIDNNVHYVTIDIEGPMVKIDRFISRFRL